jgi:hypothetical protein
MSLILHLLQGLRLGELALLLASCTLQGRLLAGAPGGARKPAEAPAAAAAAPEAKGEEAGSASTEVRSEPNATLALSPAPPPPLRGALLTLVTVPLAWAGRWLSSRAAGRRAAQLLGNALESRSLGVATLALGATQLVLEGARWQLGGLYCGSLGALCAEVLLPPLARAWRRAAGAACALATSVTALATLAFPWCVRIRVLHAGAGRSPPRAGSHSRNPRAHTVWAGSHESSWTSPVAPG